MLTALAQTARHVPRLSRNAIAGVKRPILAIGVASGTAALVLTAYVASNPFIPADETVERWMQSINWGLLALTFPVFSWIGDAKGFVLELAIFLVVLAVNRPAWLIAAGAAVSGAWYVVLNHLVHRPRPTTSQVLQVTEHPGGSSFPSGHTIFICTVVTVLVLCIGYRFLRKPAARAAAWIAGGAIVALNAIGRIDVGAHWPTDVLAGILISVAWLGLWLAWRPVWARIVRS